MARFIINEVKSYCSDKSVIAQRFFLDVFVRELLSRSIEKPLV